MIMVVDLKNGVMVVNGLLCWWRQIGRRSQRLTVKLPWILLYMSS